jgi:hypothetical protein
MSFLDRVAMITSGIALGSFLAAGIAIGLFLSGATRAIGQSSSANGVRAPSETSTGASTRWPKLPPRYCIVESDFARVSPERMEQMLQTSFEHWGVKVISDGICDGPAAPGNGRNEVYWTTLKAKDGGTTEVAQTRINVAGCLSCEGKTASIVEADIALDYLPPANMVSNECLFTTVLHEAGHFLGLEHLDSGSVMGAVLEKCYDNLTPVDRAAIETLYGP